MTALLFDFGGTLDSDGLAWKERFASALRRQGAMLARDRFERAFHAADDAITGRVSRSLSLSETVAILAENLSGELPEISREVVRAAGRAFLQDAERHLHRNRAVLGRLAGRFRLAVVSNCYGNLDGILAEEGLTDIFEAAIDSTVAGATKPDPRIFRAALDALEVPADEAVMIGDSLPRDMEGARAAGIAHIWLRGEAASGEPCCPGDPVIASVPELEGLLP